MPPDARLQEPTSVDDADHSGTQDGLGTLCGAPPRGRNVVAYEDGRTVTHGAGCWMCIGNCRAEVGW